MATSNFINRIRRKVVGATGFEPATPCAQGKLGRARKVLFLERFAALKKRCDQIWDHPSGATQRLTVTDGEMPRDTRLRLSPAARVDVAS